MNDFKRYALVDYTYKRFWAFLEGFKALYFVQ